jgi:hypothetical protein
LKPKIHKIVNYFIFGTLKKKIWASFHRIIELLPKNLSLVWDPGSGKNLFWIPDPGPGVKRAPDPGSPIRIRNTAVKQSEIQKQARLSDMIGYGNDLFTKKALSIS